MPIVLNIVFAQHLTILPNIFPFLKSKGEAKITAIPKIIVQKAVTIKSQMKYNYLISFIPKNSAAESEKIIRPLLV